MKDEDSNSGFTFTIKKYPRELTNEKKGFFQVTVLDVGYSHNIYAIIVPFGRSSPDQSLLQLLVVTAGQDC